MEETYNYKADLKNKKINYRKWKVKDRNKFLQSKDDTIQLKNALVYDCLSDKSVVLDPEEYKFMLSKIRDVSLSDKIKYNFTCTSCKHEFEYIADLDKIIKGEYSVENIIRVGSVLIEIQNIQSRDFYENSMLNCAESEKDIMTFLFSIKSFNKDNTLSFEELNEKIQELDVNIFEKIFKKYNEIKFKVNNVHGVECPKCKEIREYEFDNLPNFFPSTWK